ncbi:hypothetical protein MIND_00797400 [Mycena indigotica]|uniref:Uncharacterized protein n=1 Tax=Mycena indigotica TaxID=2126181 RepID=A0A8H6SMZ7_9AGAR|nr:uncharacterized protein MIND_00797400 [Mycena indigotica]KAF7302299.1 hypothetical protein MIND_00797400 [Mycena indigotica]
MLFECFLERAQGLPINLELSVADKSNFHEFPYEIFSSASQWVAADLSPFKPSVYITPGPLMFDIVSFDSSWALDFPHLETLTFNVWTSDLTDLPVTPLPLFQDAYRLRELTIRSPNHLSLFSFPAHQLRKLTILDGRDRPLSSEVWEILPSLVGVEDLTLPSLEDDMELALTAHLGFESRIAMLRLSRLRLFDTSSLLLPHLFLPSLGTLQLREPLSSLDYMLVKDSVPGIVSLSLESSSITLFSNVLESPLARLKHLTVTAFDMDPSAARWCTTDLGNLRNLPNLESFTLRITPDSTTTIGSILRPFIDGITMRANNTDAAGATDMKLIQFSLDFAPRQRK